jgi:hypothetical protein
MALIDLWQSAREAIKDKHIQQVMSFAGNGKLADGNETSNEFRAYLSFVPSDLLARYATECLTTNFDQKTLFLFPLNDFVSWLPGLNQTANEKRHYWHVHITQNKGLWTLLRRAGYANLDITHYLI